MTINGSVGFGPNLVRVELQISSDCYSLTSTLSPGSFLPRPSLCLGIRMWRIAYCACSGIRVCYAALYPRGRIAGGQDLLGQCSTLSSPHGSLLWTLTAWQGSEKTVTKKRSSRNYILSVRFECLLFYFHAGCTKRYWRYMCGEHTGHKGQT